MEKSTTDRSNMFDSSVGYLYSADIDGMNEKRMVELKTERKMKDTLEDLYIGSGV